MKHEERRRRGSEKEKKGRRRCVRRKLRGTLSEKCVDCRDVVNKQGNTTRPQAFRARKHAHFRQSALARSIRAHLQRSYVSRHAYRRSLARVIAAPLGAFLPT